MTWTARNAAADYLTSGCGRFDVIRSAYRGDWLAVDADRGRVARCDSRAAAQARCAVWAERKTR